MSRLFAACVLACALLIGTAAAAQSKPGIFDADRDIGDVSVKGSLTYDGMARTYTVTSSGANIWAEKDGFHYAWTRASGDLHIAADFRWIGQGTEAHRKAVAAGEAAAARLVVVDAIDESTASFDRRYGFIAA